MVKVPAGDGQPGLASHRGQLGHPSHLHKDGHPARFTLSREPVVRYLRSALVNRCKSWHRDELFRRRKQQRLREERWELPLPDPQLMRAVQKLPYRQQVVIVARYWADWPEADIADVLGCRPGTVKSLASRALARLREEVRTDDQHD